MYLMYVDESGDCGMPKDGSPTRYYCLSGLVVHELRWRDTMYDILKFRHWLKWKYKIYLEDEIHAAELISDPGSMAASFQCLEKYKRLAIVRNFADLIARLSDIGLINVVVDKMSGRVSNKDKVFQWAWYTLFQRFENTVRYQNFPGPKNTDERGVIFPDSTDGEKLKRFLKAMRVSNRIKIHNNAGSFGYIDEPIRIIIEDPILRDSRESYLIQAAYLLKQNLQPCAYMKKHGGNAYFQRLDPVLCKHACQKDPQGIVRL